VYRNGVPSDKGARFLLKDKEMKNFESVSYFTCYNALPVCPAALKTQLAVSCDTLEALRVEGAGPGYSIHFTPDQVTIGP